jgi:pilus assembly protein Flp/PilA
MSAAQPNFSGFLPDFAPGATSRMVFTTGRLVPSGSYERAICLPNPEGASMLKVLVALQNLLAEPLRRDDRGATAVEYGLILVFIAVVIIAGLTLLGTKLLALFNNVAGQI